MPIQWVTGDPTSEQKRQGRKADNSPPLPQYVFMAWYLVKHRDNFNFTD